MVRIWAGAICVSLLIVCSCKFSGEHRCAKESHSESASSWDIWCVAALGVPNLRVVGSISLGLKICQCCAGLVSLVV